MPYLEMADLHVQRERVEHHGADEGDARGHGVHYLELAVEPEPLQLGEDVERLELFQVEDLGVGQPKLLDEAHVHGDPRVGGVRDLKMHRFCINRRGS